jgi:hypothetical protein
MDGLAKYLDFLLKAVPAAGVLILLLLQGQFVTRAEYLTTSEKFSGRIESVEKLLIKLESSAERDRLHDQLLADHEARIRALEKH